MPLHRHYLTQPKRAPRINTAFPHRPSRCAHPALPPTLAFLAWLTFAPMAGNALESAERLSLSSCHLPGLSAEARCGTLQRPLDPARPDGPTIGLRVAVITAEGSRRKTDAVLFLAGGPGQSAVELAASVRLLLRPMASQRDIVLVEQRGTGRSAPLLCADDEGPEAATRPLKQMLSTAAMVKSLRACRQTLERLPHGDLRQYTTAVAAQDLEAARRALGLGPVNLVGVSYGTRLALEMLRQHPGSVRRVILDGVAPPDMGLTNSLVADAEAALEGHLAACEREQACQRAFPHLRRRWESLLASLPRSVTVTHPVTRQPESITLDAATLRHLIRMPLYTPTTASALPAAIEAAAAGHLTPLLGLTVAGSAGLRGGRAMAMGQHLSVVCTEDDPATRPAQPAAELYVGVCAEWPRGTVPAGFRDIPPSPVPVLLLSGGQDPVTPAHHARRTAQGLGSKARELVVEHAGHGVLGEPCLRETLERFIQADTSEAAVAVALECPREPVRARAWQPLPFTLPQAPLPAVPRSLPSPLPTSP